MYAKNFWTKVAISRYICVNESMDNISNMLQNALKMTGREIIMRADMAKRGRKPLPAWLRRRRIFVRLLLPPEDEWLHMLREAGHETQTEFFQEWVDVFLASRPAGRDFLKRAGEGDKP